MEENAVQTPKCYSYVRFSRPEQLRGDSLRRQLKLSEEYARENGLDIENSLKLQDLGVSAFKGKHKTHGALRKFLNLVENGEVVEGSVLIVESLDRLSREQVFDALSQFMAIINAGVRIVTLADRMEYDKEGINANIGQLLFSLMIMSRAHEESRMKAERIRAAWNGKRENIQKKKLTARAPAWLKLNSDRTAFTVVEERGKVVEQIFEMKLAGMGTYLIAKTLNQTPAAWMPENGWRESYINKILRNPAVIGQYQPHNNIDGKRIPVGPPITDYFPQIVGEDIFYQVQEKFKKNKGMGGRNGKVSNLFSHLAVCAYCGSPMTFVDKGKPPKGGRYLVCEAARRGLGCSYLSARYDDVERVVIEYCKGLDASSVLPNRKGEEKKIQALRSTLSAIKGKEAAESQKIENLSDSIATTADPRVRSMLDRRLTDALDAKENLEHKRQEVERDLASQESAPEAAKRHLANLKELCQYMKRAEGDKLVEIRLSLRDRLRELVDRIKIYPVGAWKTTPGNVEEEARYMEKYLGFSVPELVKQMEDDLRKKVKNRSNFTVTIYFPGGNFRTIKPYSKREFTMEMDRDNKVFWRREKDPRTGEETLLKLTGGQS